MPVMGGTGPGIQDIMKIKKTHLKIFLLTLALLLALINYVVINASKQPNRHRREHSAVSDPSNWASVFKPNDDSSNFLKDPIINKLDYRFIHTAEKACTNKSVDILVVRQSHVIDFDHRKLTRRTWNTRMSIRIVYLFFTGKAPHLDGLQTRVDYEAGQYGDVVQADLHDSVQNLSLLSTFMMKWVSSYCPNVSFVVIKTDDRWNNYVHILQALRQKEIDYKYFIMGNSAVVVQSPLRYAIHYYYRSVSEYTDMSFTVFAAAPLYGFPRRTAMLLYQASLRTKLFWKEDIFITGICAHRANVPVFFDHSFVYK